MPIEAVLCYLRKEGKVLLQLKAPGKFGAGKWNGPGGKIKPGESTVECVRREMKEETGLEVHNPTPAGLLNFFEDNLLVIVAHLFTATEFSGVMQANEEGELKWFAEKEIPYGQMWVDDQYWLPLVLAYKKFSGEFYFDSGLKILLSHQLHLED